MKTEIVQSEIYIAQDGKKFESKTECADYEASLKKASTFNSLRANVDAIECIGNSYPPFGYSYVDDERYEYRWYKPKNQEEIEAINDFFGVSAEQVGEWIGIEIDGDYDSFTGREDVYIITSLESSIERLTHFYAAFGYDVKIKKGSADKGDGQ